MQAIHTYERDNRAAKVYCNSNGFYVELWESGKLVETRECFEHSESWAESVAENYVDGMYSAVDMSKAVTKDVPRRLKNDVEITVKLQFTNQYSGNGETEPTREQVREALIHHAENNLWYEEKRTPVKEESNTILNTEPVSNSLETFNDIEEAMEQARAMQEDISESERLQADLEPIGVNNAYISHDIKQSHITIGTDSNEQGGNRESNLYNEDRDPLNE